MRKIIFAVGLLVAFPAFAQDASAPKQSPIEQAMNQEIGQQIGEIVSLRAALIAERQKNEELQKQIDGMKKDAPPVTKSQAP